MPTDIECNHRRAFFQLDEDFVPCQQCATELVISQVAAERARQINAEGWTPEHDDNHHSGDLAYAAVAYASHAAVGASVPSHSASAYQSISPPSYWPWDKKWWKPKTQRRDLIRAAALIVAEIERLDRREVARESIAITTQDSDNG